MLVDYCPFPFVLTLCEAAAHVVVLDHHQTAISAVEKHVASVGPLPANSSFHLQLDHSGATIAWSHWAALSDLTPANLGF